MCGHLVQLDLSGCISFDWHFDWAVNQIIMGVLRRPLFHFQKCCRLETGRVGNGAICTKGPFGSVFPIDKVWSVCCRGHVLDPFGPIASTRQSNKPTGLLSNHFPSSDWQVMGRLDSAMLVVVAGSGFN